MPLEALICVLGLVVVTYFIARPKPKPKEEDNLTNEVHSNGLPPQFPFDGGGSVM